MFTMSPLGFCIIEKIHDTVVKEYWTIYQAYEKGRAMQWKEEQQ